MDIDVDILRRRVEALENTVMRLESSITRLDTQAIDERIKTAALLLELKRNQTGPRKNLGI